MSTKHDAANFCVGLLFRSSRMKSIRSGTLSYAALNFLVLFIGLLNTHLYEMQVFFIYFQN